MKKPSNIRLGLPQGCTRHRHVVQISVPLTKFRQISSATHGIAARTSTVHRGTAFEERSLSLLRQNMSMSLKRVGGKEDGGVDLLGWWWLPTTNLPTTSPLERRRIRVIGQCKAEKKKLGPNYVRELEGVLYRFLTDTSENPILSSFSLEDDFLSRRTSVPMVALLISESAFTKSTFLRANSSPIPFFLLHLPALSEYKDDTAMDPQGEPLGEIGTAWCNPALCSMTGLLMGRMELRWERHSSGERARPGLWWDGVKLPSWTPDLSLSKEYAKEDAAATSLRRPVGRVPLGAIRLVE